MKRLQTITRGSAMLLALVIGFAGLGSVAQAGSISYIITTDTTTLAGSSGYLDYQFNPTTSSSPAATATVTGFLSDGVLGSVLLPNIGDASGTLPGTLTSDNGTSTNELTQAFTFGHSIGFVVTLSGPAVGGSAPSPADGSTFAFTLFDASGTPLSTGPGGSIVTIDIDGSNGSTTGAAYPSLDSPGPIATVTATSVPEPSSLILMGAGLTALFGWVRLSGRPTDHRGGETGTQLRGNGDAASEGGYERKTRCVPVCGPHGPRGHHGRPSIRYRPRRRVLGKTGRPHQTERRRGGNSRVVRAFYEPPRVKPRD